jgi:hypothetical protein
MKDSKYLKFNMGLGQHKILKMWLDDKCNDKPEIKRTIETCFQNNKWPEGIDLKTVKVNFMIYNLIAHYLS